MISYVSALPIGKKNKKQREKIWKREMRAGYKRQFVEKQIFM